MIFERHGARKHLRNQALHETHQPTFVDQLDTSRSDPGMDHLLTPPTIVLLMSEILHHEYILYHHNASLRLSDSRSCRIYSVKQ